MDKQLTLNQTWTLCLRMWRWIAQKWKKLKRKPIKIENWAVQQKEKWLKENGFFDEHVLCHCFFCEYAKQHETLKRTDCVADRLCPGTKVDPKFECYEAGWDSDPPKFLKELLRLNKIRKGRK